MLWNLLLILAALGLIPLWWWSTHQSSSYHDNVAAGATTILVVALLLVPSAIGTGTNSFGYSQYTHSSELVAMKRQQRDDLAAIIKTELSSDQYATLMAATPDANIEVLIGGNHAATDLLLERAKTLVAFNADVNAMVNQLAKKRIDLCAYADNPLTPRLFVRPRCPAPLAVTP